MKAAIAKTLIAAGAITDCHISRVSEEDIAHGIWKREGCTIEKARERASGALVFVVWFYGADLLDELTGYVDTARGGWRLFSLESAYRTARRLGFTGEIKIDDV